MITQHRDRKHIAILLLLLIVVVFMPGCSTMSIEYPEDKAVIEPCVGWVMTNKTQGDKVIYGMFTPANEAHAWLERGGVCYDNMNNGGFLCDDNRYKLFRVVANDAELRTLLIMGVAYKP